MTIYWQDRDISRFVTVRACVYRDVSGGQSDGLEISMDKPEDWHRWRPETNDRVRLTDGDLDTGTMYLNALVPDGRSYRMIATGIRAFSARKKFETYTGVTLRDLFETCAGECGMTGRLFGTDGENRFDVLQRCHESAPGFLARVSAWENILVKACAGELRGIYLPWAQEMDAARRLLITAGQEGVSWKKRESARARKLTVLTPWASATATDTLAQGESVTVTSVPAMNGAQALRFARGLITMLNRRSEEIRLETALDTRLMALCRVDVTGGTGMVGRWIVDRAEHDLMHKTTQATLYRVIDTVE